MSESRTILAHQEFVSNLIAGIRNHPNTKLIVDSLVEFELSRFTGEDPKFNGAVDGIPVLITEENGDNEPCIRISLPRNWYNVYCV